VFHIVFIFFVICKLANVNVCVISNEEINQFKPSAMQSPPGRFQELLLVHQTSVCLLPLISLPCLLV